MTVVLHPVDLERLTWSPGDVEIQDVELGWRYNPDELRNEHGEWTRTGGEVSRAEGSGYLPPDHSRLINPRGTPHDPADHPFFKQHPVSPGNVIASYDRAPAPLRQQGMRWYADAHTVAKAIAGSDAEKGSVLLAAYSPQSAWPVNMFNAARAVDLGRAIGPGEGMITGSMQANAQKAFDGDTVEDALHSPKTRSFGRLIRNGGDTPGDTLGDVVIDRHAMTVAMGVRLPKAAADKAPIGTERYYQYVADQYRIAAQQISERDGTQVSPHQLQAITWLQQQDENEDTDAADTSPKTGRLAHGRATMIRNAWQHWQAESQADRIPVHAGTTMVAAANTITRQALDATLICEQVLDLASRAHDTASASARRTASEHARDAWHHEIRAPDGRWITGADRNDVLTKAATGRAARGVRLHDVVLYGKTEPRPDRLGLQSRMVPMEVTGLHHHWEGSGKTPSGKSRRHRYTDMDLTDPETGEVHQESLKDGTSVKLFPREHVRAMGAPATAAPAARAQPADWRNTPFTAPSPAPPPVPPPHPVSAPAGMAPPGDYPGAPAVTQASMDTARQAVDAAGLSPAEHETASRELARIFDKTPELAGIVKTVKFQDQGLGATGRAARGVITLDSGLIHDPAKWDALTANRGEKGWGKNFFADVPLSGKYSGLRYSMTHEAGHELSWETGQHPGGGIAVLRAVAGAYAGHDFPAGHKGLMQAAAVLSDKRRVRQGTSDYATHNWEEDYAEAFAAYSLGGHGKGADAGEALVDTVHLMGASSQHRAPARAAAPEKPAAPPPPAPVRPAEGMAPPGNYPGAPQVSQHSLDLARQMVDKYGDGITPELHEVASREMAKLLDIVPGARDLITSADPRMTNHMGMRLHWEKDLIKNENATGATNLRYGMSLDPLLLTGAAAQDADRKQQLSLPPAQSVYADEPGNTGSYQAFRDVLTHEFGHVLAIKAEWSVLHPEISENMHREIATALAEKPEAAGDWTSELTRVGAQVDGYAAADPQESLAEMFDVAVFGGKPESARQVGQILAKYAQAGQQPVMPSYNFANEDAGPAGDLCFGRTFSAARIWQFAKAKGDPSCTGFQPGHVQLATLISEQAATPGRNRDRS